MFLQSVLGYEVRMPGAAHNCLDDACAAMKLVLAKPEHGEISLIRDVWTFDCLLSLISFFFTIIIYVWLFFSGKPGIST